MPRSGPEVPKQRDGDQDADADRVQVQRHAPLESVERALVRPPRLAGGGAGSHRIFRFGVHSVRVRGANQ